jgi:plastocyanin
MPFPPRRMLYGSCVHLVVAALIILLTACSGPSSTPVPADTQPQAAKGTATISGRVTFEGVPPANEIIRFDADPQCVAETQGEMPRDEAVLLGERSALQNVFVYVMRGLPAARYAPPANAVVLDQQKCRYMPRVLGVQVGQALTIRNSDPLLHTVRADATDNPRFNVATPLRGVEVTRTFRAPEVMVPIKCDMHPWMQAHVGVLDHPFFSITDPSGTFSVSGLPPGTFTLAAWHERFGTRTQEITLEADESRSVSFVYGPMQ